MMKNGRTCPLIIWSKLCITSGCNNWGIVTLVYTHWHLMIMFGLSNNLHYMENICKGVQLVMNLIGMNRCWGGPNGLVIFLNEWLVAALANYIFVFTFFYRILHLKGEEVCGYAKLPTNYPPSVNNDSRHLDHVNFSRPRITVHVVQPNVVGNIGMQQPPYGFNACLPLVSWGGLEFKENICVDGQWWIERCPPNFAVWCFALQKPWSSNVKQILTFTNL